MKALVTDCSDFERIVSADNVYVDKTDQFYRLISGASSRFFIARPRRFGKSLMLSTLECIFLGRKDLFDGLALQQAINKDYAGPFANGHRPVYLVGVNYNPGKRTIDPPKCKRMCE